MKLNNSIKLVVANFSLFWKILAYKVIAIALGCLFYLPVSGIVNNNFVSSGFLSKLTSFLQTSVFQNFSVFIGKMYEVINSFFNSIGQLASEHTLTFIYILLLFVVIIPFLLKLSDLPSSECVYGYMSSLNKNSFVGNFIELIGKSSVYSIFKIALQLPFIIIFGFGVYGILYLGTLSIAWSMVSPLLLFVFGVFALAFISTIYNGWTSSIVVFSVCPAKGLKRGLKAVGRNYLSVMSSFAIVMACVMCVIYLFGLYSLIVIVPLLSLVLAVFGQVLFFESQGMNYYVSPDKIVTPRKLENTDKMKKVKFVI